MIQVEDVMTKRLSCIFILPLPRTPTQLNLYTTYMVRRAATFICKSYLDITVLSSTMSIIYCMQSRQRKKRNIMHNRIAAISLFPVI